MPSNFPVSSWSGRTADRRSSTTRVDSLDDARRHPCAKGDELRKQKYHGDGGDDATLGVLRRPRGRDGKRRAAARISAPANSSARLLGKPLTRIDGFVLRPAVTQRREELPSFATIFVSPHDWVASQAPFSTLGHCVGRGCHHDVDLLVWPTLSDLPPRQELWRSSLTHADRDRVVSQALDQSGRQRSQPATITTATAKTDAEAHSAATASLSHGRRSNVSSSFLDRLAVQARTAVVDAIRTVLHPTPRAWRRRAQPDHPQADRAVIAVGRRRFRRLRLREVAHPVRIRGIDP